jgi:urease accessory protein
VAVKVDRHTLARRRWRVAAEDGCDLAVDLENPVKDGTALYVCESCVYVVSQDPEAVIEISIPTDPMKAAALGWFLGNQHLPVQILEKVVRLEATPHLEDRLKREGLKFERCEAVFAPAPHSVGHAHGHGHSHLHAPSDHRHGVWKADAVDNFLPLKR